MADSDPMGVFTPTYLVFGVGAGFGVLLSMLAQRWKAVGKAHTNDGARGTRDIKNVMEGTHGASISHANEQQTDLSEILHGMYGVLRYGVGRRAARSLH